MRRMTVFLILGAGMMGTALGFSLARKGHEVRLVGTHLDRAIVDSIRDSGLHPKLGLTVPPGITAFHHEDLPAALPGCDQVALGVSSAGVNWACAALGPVLPAGTPLFMITKGLRLHEGRLVTLPDAVKSLLPEAVRASIHPAAVAGPCIAGELARDVPTCVVLAGRDAAANARIAAAIAGEGYHVFPTTDVEGAETCAALKNAYAMGIAFALGLHEKRGGAPSGSLMMHNLESATMAQAVLEMGAVVRALGGRPGTASGLAGVGDLDVTTNGGRTGRFGRLLGLGNSPSEAVAKMEGATLECLEILAVMREAFRAGAVPGLALAQLPLLAHMIDVALDGAPVDVPLGRFFGADLS